MALNTSIRGLQIKDAFFGAGLARNGSDGNIMDIQVDDSSIEVSGDALQVKASGITNDMLAGSIADGKLASDYIQTSEVDGTTIEFSGSTLNIVAGGVGTTQLANDSVDKDKINADVAGDGLGQNVSGALEVNVDDSTIEINTDTLRVKDAGITDAKLANDYIQTTEVDGTTIEFAGSTLNVVSGGIDTAQLADEAVEVAKLAINNAEQDGYVLTWNTSGYMEWTAKTSTDAVADTDVKFEDETANVDGIETDFTLSSTPIANSVQVFLNGLLQQVGSGKDYTISGTTVSFATAPASGDILLIHYIAQ